MASDLATVEKALRDVIEQDILMSGAPLKGDEDLYATGFDSMSLSRVLVFVEERFGVTIPDGDIVIDEVSTIDTLARFVHERVAAAGK